MRLLAVRYKATTNATYKAAFKASFQKAVGFIIASELPNGGWPQMYPKRGNYSDMATYNDNGMIRAMVLIKDIIEKELGVEREKLTPEASFIEDLGADSLDIVELVMEFEKEFNIDIPDEDAEIGDTRWFKSPEVLGSTAIGLALAMYLMFVFI